MCHFTLRSCAFNTVLFVTRICAFNTVLFVTRSCAFNTVLFVTRSCAFNTVLLVTRSCAFNTVLFVTWWGIGFISLTKTFNVYCIKPLFGAHFFIDAQDDCVHVSKVAKVQLNLVNSKSYGLIVIFLSIKFLN